MAIKNYKPTTPSRRNMSVTDYSSLSKVAPERSLLEPISKKSGRNSYGRITVRHRGGGNRKKYRVIDFKRQKFDVPATVQSIEYDPNRSAHIALIKYEDGIKNYIIAPEGLKVGATVVAGPDADIVAGNARTGQFIYSVENNRLYRYSIPDKLESESPLANLPAGNITYLYDIFYSYSFDYIVIGIQNGDTYTVQMYNIEGSRPSGEPVHSFSGTGILQKICYVCPTSSYFMPNYYSFLYSDMGPDICY